MLQVTSLSSPEGGLNVGVFLVVWVGGFLGVYFSNYVMSLGILTFTILLAINKKVVLKCLLLRRQFPNVLNWENTA